MSKLARNSDPDSSHEAVETLADKGTLAIQREEVLRAVQKWPGLTSKELAEKAGLDRHLVARRLPELRDHFAAVASAGSPLRWCVREWRV